MKSSHNSDRIVICNWNVRGDRVIKELHADQALPNCPIVILSEYKIDTAQYHKEKVYQNVTFICGDPYDKEVLKFVNAHQAMSVIILADDKAGDPDAKSALIALAISKLCEREADGSVIKYPHISAETLNHRKMEHLRDAGVDEIICAVDYGLGLLAQSAIVENISAIYDNLLSYSDETNEIYILKSPKNVNDKDADISYSIWEKYFLGKSLKEIIHFLADHRHSLNPAILLGVRCGKIVILNPRVDENRDEQKFDVFNKGDDPIFMAYEKPMYLKDELEEFEKMF